MQEDQTHENPQVRQLNERLQEEVSRRERQARELITQSLTWGSIAVIASFFVGREFGSNSTEQKVWDHATTRARAVYATGVCHGALFKAAFDPLPQEARFFGDEVHHFSHKDHVVEVMKRFGVARFTRVPQGPWGPGGTPHPADWACSPSTRFLPEDLAVSLEDIETWIEEGRPGGALWDRETGLTGQDLPPVP